MKSLIFGGDFGGSVEGGDGLKPLGDKKRWGVGKEDRRKSNGALTASEFELERCLGFS